MVSEVSAREPGPGLAEIEAGQCLFLKWIDQTREAELVGVLMLNGDDIITGGEGPGYEKALADLNAKFPSRKWE